MINVANNKSPHLVAVNLTLLRVVDVLVNMFVAAKDMLETFVCRTIRIHRVCGDWEISCITLTDSGNATINPTPRVTLSPRPDMGSLV